MRLDLGGIAKGYALDQLLRVLEDHGVSSALVDGGGDVAVSAPPPGTRGWRVELFAVTSGDDSGRTALVLAHAAVATSGDLARSVQIGAIRYSHIVDPRTGLGLTTRTGASVVARDGMTADAFATAASVLGAEACARNWQALGVELRVVTAGEQGVEVVESRGFARFSER
jgi:thiamine biosynthesis lipoprotein